MIVYILPVALFVVTLIIILALRAEDKKSRSLQIVKDRIQAFRSETQQTMARINETAKDASERVDAKTKEVAGLIAEVDGSLDKLSRHRNDLAALESICRGYEVALDKLRIQTEHAEDRIGAVSREVEKASQIDSVVKAFEDKVAAVRADMDMLAQSFDELVGRSRDDLDQVAREHEETARELRSRFVDDLSASREDFGTYIDDVRSDMDRRQDELRSYVDASRDELGRQGQEAMSQVEQSITRLGQEREDLGSFIDESRTSLESLRSGIEEFRTSVMASLDDGRTQLEQEKEACLADASSTYERLAGELAESSAKMESAMNSGKEAMDAAISSRREQLDEFLEAVKADVSSLDERRAGIEEQVGRLSAKGDEVFDDFSTRVQDLSTSSRNSFSSLMMEGEDNLTRLAQDLRSRFESDSAEQFRRLDEARSSFSALHQEQKAVFDSMTAAGTEQLGNFARKLTEIREAVSMLNQGVNESLGRAAEKLAQIQSRLTASEASLNDTQSKVTTAKEELFNIQREHKAIQDEVGKARKELEWLQLKAQDARRDRQNEEARMVKLQMEDGRRGAPGDEGAQFVGQEEDIPIDDE